MARNVEKDRSMLNQWLKLKDVEERNTIFRIPKNVKYVDDLERAKECRTYLIKELCRKISEIQNYSLSDQHIRELNDQINKLIYIKNNWEVRIVELGGPNYQKESNDLIKVHGVELKGDNQYRYFGAAKNLKGVKELLHRENEERKKEELERKKNKQCREHMANVYYYGYTEFGQAQLSDEENLATERMMVRDLKTLKRLRRSKNNNQCEARIQQKNGVGN